MGKILTPEPTSVYLRYTLCELYQTSALADTPIMSVNNYCSRLLMSAKALVWYNSHNVYRKYTLVGSGVRIFPIFTARI